MTAVSSGNTCRADPAMPSCSGVHSMAEAGTAAAASSAAAARATMRCFMAFSFRQKIGRTLVLRISFSSAQSRVPVRRLRRLRVNL